jgi:hypothetical protein
MAVSQCEETIQDSGGSIPLGEKCSRRWNVEIFVSFCLERFGQAIFTSSVFLFSIFAVKTLPQLKLLNDD